MIYPQIFILCCTYIDRKEHENNVFTFSNIFKIKAKKIACFNEDLLTNFFVP